MHTCMHVCECEINNNSHGLMYGSKNKRPLSNIKLLSSKRKTISNSVRVVTQTQWEEIPSNQHTLITPPPTHTQYTHLVPLPQERELLSTTWPVWRLL